MLNTFALRKILNNAFEEDIGFGDLTTSSVLTGTETGKARAIAKSETVVAGIEVFRESFRFLDESVIFEQQCANGMRVGEGTVLAEITGKLAGILTAERVALNLFQRMCGIATLTRKFVDAVEGTNVKILDTRKTAPGLRNLDKYAVRMGGGFNHRFSLNDGILIKDNHISAAGGIIAALSRARKNLPHVMKIEIEVKNLREAKEALDGGADVIMLDNMSILEMKEAVSFVQGRALLEASGGVTLANVRQIADTGVNLISIGALTHSAPASDISLTIEEMSM